MRRHLLNIELKNSRIEERKYFHFSTFQFFNIIILILTTVLGLTSCDDGHINDPVHNDGGATYTARLSGTFHSVGTWSGSYSVAMACFGDESAYSLLQTVIPASSDDESQVLTLTNIPSEAKTIEIAVVNVLRERIATIYSYTVPADQRVGDTIKLDVGTLDVGMFGAINQFIFQGQATSCARCHSGAAPAAGLDLSPTQAYRCLVGADATKAPSMARVLPGNAQESFLYKVITEGDDNVSYSHPALFADPSYAPFVEIIRNWIEAGAKE